MLYPSQSHACPGGRVAGGIIKSTTEVERNQDLNTGLFSSQEIPFV